MTGPEAAGRHVPPGSPGSATPTPVEEAAHRLAEFLRVHRRVEFCGPCLSATLTIRDDAVEAAVALLARGRGFRRDQWFCFRCRRTGSVIRAL